MSKINLAQARSGLILGAAHAMEMVLPFARSVVMARLMTPREFAISLAIVAVVGIAEMITDIGLAQLAVKSAINDARARATLHTLAIARSGLIGVIIAAAALPLAYLFEAPETPAAFTLAGLSVAMRGFSHLGFKQLGRSFQFGTEAVVILTSQAIWTLGVVALALVWPDHRAAVGGLLLHAAAFVAISHIVSPLRYELGWSRPLVAQAVSFGRPLVPNGIALAITALGDRMVIGARISLEALALYGPLATMASLPRSAVVRFANTLFLPAIVRDIEAGRDGAAPMRGWIAAISFVGVVFPLGFMCLATPVIGVLYGPRYAPSSTLTGMMALLLWCRIVAVYPVPLAVATGKVWFVTAASVVSAAALVFATVGLYLLSFASFERGLAFFLETLVAAETIGIAILLLRMRRSFAAAPAGLIKDCLASFVPVFAIVGGLTIYAPQDLGVRLLSAIAGGIIAAVVFLPRFKPFLRNLR